MAARSRLRLERLEDRTTPATTGVTWPDGRHLTISFVPDGTPVAGYQSNLFQELNAVAPPADWQREILRAFQTWAVHANINVGIVADGGQSMGGPGAVQGDSRFGDVRVAAVPMPPGTLMTNTAFQWSGTTWSGDLVINSSYTFSIGAQSGAYDLFTAALNEAGNVLGVVDTRKDPTSGVYYKYIGVKTGINANDIADIRSLYGPRGGDHFEAITPNDSFATASPLGNLGAPRDPEADITTTTDVDYYKFTIPLTSPPIVGFRVDVVTGGVSSLTPGLMVYSSLTLPIVGSLSADPLTGTISCWHDEAIVGQAFYVRVCGNGTGVFATGGYRLNVTFLQLGGQLSSLIGNATALPSDDHGNDTIATATDLTPPWSVKPDARFDAASAGKIDDATDVDIYKIRSPNVPGKPQKLNVLVWAGPGGSLVPKVELFSATGQPIPARLLGNENRTFSIELIGVPSLTTYYVRVSALEPEGENNTGAYRFGANFGTNAPTALTEFAEGSLPPGAPPDRSPLTISRNSLTQFILSASSGPGSTWGEVRMTIVNSAGAPVFTLRAYSGKYANSGHAYLPAGQYTMIFTAHATPGPAATKIEYRLMGRLVSDPIGPQRDRGSLIATPPAGGKTTGGSALTKDGWDAPYYF